MREKNGAAVGIRTLTPNTGKQRAMAFRSRSAHIGIVGSAPPVCIREMAIVLRSTSDYGGSTGVQYKWVCPLKLPHQRPGAFGMPSIGVVPDGRHAWRNAASARPAGMLDRPN